MKYRQQCIASLNSYKNLDKRARTYDITYHVVYTRGCFVFNYARILSLDLFPLANKCIKVDGGRRYVTSSGITFRQFKFVLLHPDWNWNSILASLERTRLAICERTKKIISFLQIFSSSSRSYLARQSKICNQQLYYSDKRRYRCNGRHDKISGNIGRILRPRSSTKSGCRRKSRWISRDVEFNPVDLSKNCI